MWKKISIFLASDGEVLLPPSVQLLSGIRAGEQSFKTKIFGLETPHLYLLSFKLFETSHLIQMYTLQLPTFGRTRHSKIGPSIHTFAELYFTSYVSKMTIGYTSFRIFLQSCMENIISPTVHVVHQPKIIFLERIVDQLTRASSDHFSRGDAENIQSGIRPFPQLLNNVSHTPELLSRLSDVSMFNWHHRILASRITTTHNSSA